MFKSWIQVPIRDIITLTHRQESIRLLQTVMSKIQPYLRQIGDLERILARLALRSARPRDLMKMRHALIQLSAIQEILYDFSSDYLLQLKKY